MVLMIISLKEAQLVNMWKKFFSQIYLLNLEKRVDRLLKCCEIFEQYNIPYKRISAIEKENGAEGLKDTMMIVFEDAIKNNYQNILVFEDDVKFVESVELFNETMNKVIEQIPSNYHTCFLGCQATAGFPNWYSTNLLPLNKGFATHSVMYSLQGINEIMVRGMGYPIDNWMVDEIQTLGHSYCVFPLLCTQYEGDSDIGKTWINWDVFITQRYNQKINELRCQN